MHQNFLNQEIFRPNFLLTGPKTTNIQDMKPSSAACLKKPISLGKQSGKMRTRDKTGIRNLLSKYHETLSGKSAYILISQKILDKYHRLDHLYNYKIIP